MKKQWFYFTFGLTAMFLAGCGLKENLFAAGNEAGAQTSAAAGEETAVEISIQEETTEEAASGKEAETAAAKAGVLEQVPREFVFSSGAGGWATILNLNPDGTFAGMYQDGEMGVTGEGYPKGTTYICNFHGKFSDPVKQTDFIYSMKLEELIAEDTPDREYIEDGIRYVVSEPCGLDHADEFLLYLPGTPLSEVSEDFLPWSSLNTEIFRMLPDGYYGIYNVGGQEGFVGISEQSIWTRDYVYQYGNCRVFFMPSYYMMTELCFMPADGAAVIRLPFQWQENGQTEFDVTDSCGTGDYHLSLIFSGDFSSASVAVTSKAGTDLTAWGGTADGRFSAEFVDESL